MKLSVRIAHENKEKGTNEYETKQQFLAENSIKLFIKGLPEKSEYNEESLMKEFEKFGKVMHMDLLRNFGFVHYR